MKKVPDDFPMLKQEVNGKKLVYLDSAATSLKPQCVIDTLSDFYASGYGTVHRAVYHFAAKATERYHAARCTAQLFLNAKSPDEIIFTKGTTEGINLVAASFGKAFLQAGDEVILSVMEHHSNLVPWQMLAKERGIVLKFIPINERAELILEEFDKLLTARTKLVSIAHIANSTGTLNPVSQIIERAHAKGVKVLIDGAQSALHMRVDVQEMDADFYVFSGHKTFGPTGIGILYGKAEILDQMPPYQGGGDMIDKVTLGMTTYQEPPLRFEAGTPLIAEAIGLSSALNYIQALGREEIHSAGEELRTLCTEKLLQIEGVRLIGSAAHKGPIVTFVAEGTHPLDIGTLLDLRGIAVRTGHLCAQPTMEHFGITSAVRASFAPYNTPTDILFFCQQLQEVLALLRS
jgi:cysteine desulfurase/selenocysteine lyase